ncbi:MAG: hypothetical protein ACOC8K_03755 [Gemmatimonadota bacterium]
MSDVDERVGHRPRNPGHFGPAVIGEEQYQKEKEMVETGADRFGPAVVDSHPVTEAEGTRKPVSDEESPRRPLREPTGPSVGQFDLVGGRGGWYKAEHAPTGGLLVEDGTLTDDPDEAKSFGQGEENAQAMLRELLSEVGAVDQDVGETFRDQEVGPRVTEPSPRQVSEAEAAVRERMDEEGYLSLEDQEELLEEAGDRLRDRIIDAEFGRADGVRKAGLRNLIEAEKQREGGPRARVLNRLERAFAELTAAAGS